MDESTSVMWTRAWTINMMKKWYVMLSRAWTLSMLNVNMGMSCRWIALHAAPRAWRLMYGDQLVDTSRPRGDEKYGELI